MKAWLVFFGERFGLILAGVVLGLLARMVLGAPADKNAEYQFHTPLEKLEAELSEGGVASPE